MSCAQVKRITAQLEAARVYWGYGQCREYTFITDVAGAQNGATWDLNRINPDGTEDEFYVLLDNGAASDPEPAGKTKISVSFTNGDTAATLATAYVTAVLDVTGGGFFASSTAGVATVENWYPGAVTAEVVSGSEGVTASVERAGMGGNLGATSEGIEISKEISTVDITSNQTGGLILDQILQGNSVELSASFLEATSEFWKTVVGQVTGDTVTPGGGTDFVGYGESKLFKSLVDLGGRLILHPIRLADTDRSADVVFWRCAPIPSSINYDGTAAQAMSSSFRPYLDAGKDKKINLYGRGDWTQQGLDA